MKNKIVYLFLIVFSLSVTNASAGESESDLNKRVRIHDLLLKIYLAKHQNKQAVAEYQTLLKLSPNNPALEYAYANYLYKYGNVKESIAHYRKAFECAPDNADYAAKLGSILFYAKDYDGAVSAYTNACRIGGSRFQPQLNSALQYQASIRAARNAAAAAAARKSSDDSDN